MEKHKVKIWDSPTRIFHWALVINIIAAWYTIENRLIDLHQIAGYSLMGLIIFRVFWGIIGSTTSRFTFFITSPLTAFTYLKLSLQQKLHHEVGHNPAGGWMVLIMLIILSTQVITGLFANDDLGFSGILSDYVKKETSDFLTQIHQLNFDILIGIIWIHLVAVFFYVLVKKDNLIKAMFTGTKNISSPITDKLHFSTSLLALLFFSIISVFIIWLIRL